jgi:protein-S-isoprenylcysteine O-methyltransferase
VITILGYLVIAGFFLTETRMRTGDEAKSWKTGQFDQRSTLYITIAYLVSGIALAFSWILNRFGIAMLPTWVGWVGLGVAIFGILFRWWANRVLGAFYTRTLKVVENQTIVRAGPYGVIRHPGYLGSILMWTGVAVSTTNWIVTLVVLIVMLIAYVYRIQTEEKMLVSMNPDYAEYRKGTWRLMPFVY